MIMEMDRVKAKFYNNVFPQIHPARSSIVLRRRIVEAAPGAHSRDRGARVSRVRAAVRIDAHGADDSSGVRREDGRGAYAPDARARARTRDDAAPYGKGRLRAPAAKWRARADLREEGCCAGARFRALQDARYRRHHRRRRL